MAHLPSNIRWEVDPDRPLRTGFQVDHANGELTVVHEEDVEFVLQQNEKLFNASSQFRRRNEEWHMWARIPPGVIMKWKAELGIDIFKSEDWKKIVALLHDPDWKKLRTAAGSYQQTPTRHYHSTIDQRASSLIGKRGGGAPLRKGGI